MKVRFYMDTETVKYNGKEIKCRILDSNSKGRLCEVEIENLMALSLEEDWCIQRPEIVKFEYFLNKADAYARIYEWTNTLE